MKDRSDWEITKNKFYIEFENYIKNDLNLPVQYNKSYIGFGKMHEFYMFWIKTLSESEYMFYCRLKYQLDRKDNVDSLRFSEENKLQIMKLVENIYTDYKDKGCLYDVEHADIKEESNDSYLNENYDEDSQSYKELACLLDLLREELKNKEEEYVFSSYSRVMSVRLYNALCKANIKSFNALSEKTAKQIWRIRNLGKKSVNELSEVITGFLNNTLQIKEFPKRILEKSNMTVLVHTERLVLEQLKRGETFEAELEEETERYPLIAQDIVDCFDLCMRLMLTERECAICKMYANQDEKNTFQQVANEFGVTRERIRQIINKATRKIKNGLRRTCYLNQRNSFIDAFNSIETDKFLNLIIYGFYMNYNVQLVQFILSIFYSSAFIRSLMNYCKDVMEQKKHVIKNINIFDDAVFPSGFRINEFDVGDFLDSPEVYSYQRKTRNLLSQLPDVKKIIHRPKIVYYQSEATSHVPDFLVELEDGRNVLILALPTINLGYGYNVNRFNAIHKFCENKGLGYLIINDRFKTIQQIKQTYIEDELKSEFDYILEKTKYIAWKDIVYLKKYYKITPEKIVSYVLNNRLNFRIKPKFMISRRLRKE